MYLTEKNGFKKWCTVKLTKATIVKTTSDVGYVVPSLRREPH